MTGLEFMNKRYNPFEIQLEGWSENVMENVDDYDEVFEELYVKCCEIRVIRTNFNETILKLRVGNMNISDSSYGRDITGHIEITVYV